MREHDGKEDEQGQYVDGARLLAAQNYRLYQRVTPGMLLRVRLKNLSEKPLSFVLVYVGVDGSEEHEGKIDLASLEVRGLVEGRACRVGESAPSTLHPGGCRVFALARWIEQTRGRLRCAHAPMPP